MAFPGTRRYTSNSFFIIQTMTVGTQKKNFNLLFAAFDGPCILQAAYQVIYDNGASNVHKSPLTTELTTLGHVFGNRRQNYQNKALVEKKNFWSKMVNTLDMSHTIWTILAGFRPNSEIIGKFLKMGKFYDHFVKLQK